MPSTRPPSLYELLGVEKDATQEELRAAYRAAAKAHHPDVNPNAEAGKFGKIAEAYDVLRDPDKRRLYDSVEDGGGGGGGGSGFPGSTARGGGGEPFERWWEDFYGKFRRVLHTGPRTAVSAW